MDTDEKDTLFLFDSLGTLGLLSFIVEDDLDIFNKLIPGQFKQIFPEDYEITLLKWKFSMEKYKKLKDKEVNKLSDTAKHFYKFLYKFGKYKGVKNTFMLQLLMIMSKLLTVISEDPFKCTFI